MRRKIGLYLLAPIAFLAIVASIRSASTDFWTISGRGTSWGQDVARLDSDLKFHLANASGTDVFTSDASGNVAASGTLAVTGAATFSANQNMAANKAIVWGGGVAISTATTSTYSQGNKAYAYLGGDQPALEGSVLIATTAVNGQGLTAMVAPATLDQTGVIGIAAAATSSGSVVPFYYDGFVLALTTGAINAGDVLVTTATASSYGYLGADTTPTTGADVAVALQTRAANTSGLLKVRIVK
jgi:hypothetical protein